MRLKFLAAAVAAIFFNVPAAQAESLSQTLETFGFFGRWAIHCDAPASSTNNMRIALLSPTGDPIFTESLGGSGEPNSYVILRARRQSTDTLVLRVKLNGSMIQELTIRRVGDRLRTISNRDVARGKYVVREGQVVSTKQDTPWLTRCEQAPPPNQGRI